MTRTMEVEVSEYQVIIVTKSKCVLLIAGERTPEIPCIEVPKGRRPVQTISTALKQDFGIFGFILEVFPLEDGFGGCAIAEFIGSTLPSGFVVINSEDFLVEAYPRQVRTILEEVLADRVLPVARLGWFNDAVTWVERATGLKLAARTSPHQLNGGRGFALICFSMENGQRYWLKATGQPNEHEYHVTNCLNRLCPGYVPTVIANSDCWNAWLSKDEGASASESMSLEQFDRAVHCLAHLQHKSMSGIDSILAAGAFDQRLPVLLSHIDQIIRYLIEAMERQTSTRAIPIPADRLMTLGALLECACMRMKALGIPDVILHNDLNPGNILFHKERCVIADWSEAAVGNPFLSFDRLCALNDANSQSGRAVYANFWLKYLSQTAVNEAFVLAPLLAIYSHLYGRGTWLTDSKTVSSPSEGYARSLARHLDRAAQSPQLLKVLGRC